MKAKTLKSIGPIAAGTTVEVVHRTPHGGTIRFNELCFAVPGDAVEFIEEEETQAAEPAPAPRVERYVPEPEVETLARTGYESYCHAVGGKAFNGDPLPTAAEFFEDPAKQLQANAWRFATEAIISKGYVMSYISIPKVGSIDDVLKNDGGFEEKEEERRKEFMNHTEQLKPGDIMCMREFDRWGAETHLEVLAGLARRGLKFATPSAEEWPYGQEHREEDGLIVVPLEDEDGLTADKTTDPTEGEKPEVDQS